MVQETTNHDKPLVEEQTTRKKRKEKKRKLEDSSGQDEKDLRRASRRAKRQEKQDLLSKVPKVDGDGIQYTKIQIKRMLKRVKRGLHPVPTEHEELERLQNEAKMRKDDEAEFAGLTYQKEDEKGVTQGDDEEEETGEVIIEAIEESFDASQASEEESMKDGNDQVEEDKAPFVKKAKRSKPVPPDYTCQACNNKFKPAHWIYDCSMKVTVRGRNQKKKKLRGINEPDSRKIFVSGLPFDVKPADVTSLFKACGKVVNCKLIKFGDTGRCNGQAYVSFDTDEAASKAMKLSGTMIENTSDDAPKKKGGKSSEPSKRKQLKLKVSKAANRRATSMKGR